MTPKLSSTRQLIASEYLDRYPEETAHLLENEPPEEVAPLLVGAPESRALPVLERMGPDAAAAVLLAMDQADAVRLLGRLDAATAVALLMRIPLGTSQELVEQLPPAQAKELRELMTYPPDTAGRLMEPRVVTIRPENTAGEVLNRLRGLSGRRVQDIFLVDGDGKLVGSVDLQEVALAHPEMPVERLKVRAPVAVQAMAPSEDVLDTAQRSGRAALPVIDMEGRLLGVILSDALMSAAQEEVSADMQTMVGASRDERALSPPFFAVRKRLPWLEINLVTAFLAAAVVGLFEGLIAKVTALAVLLPVVAGQSGNTGAQALAVTMRGLTLREIRLRHWWRVTLKETGVGFLNGVAVALTTASVVYLWSRSLGLAMIIGFSMVISMVAAGLAGAGIPILLTAVGQDPAQSSSIILTTVTDVVGFFSFLGIATLLIRFV